MRSKGFGHKWCEWISILLRTASTRVIVNGVPGRSFIHAKGLRQGDPISPLLFVIAMDVRTSLITRAQECNVLSTMLSCMPMQMIYIYADDVVRFLRMDLDGVLCVFALGLYA